MNFDEQCYLRDPYTVDFSARVVEARETDDGHTAVYLDRTFFYPDSGGQPDDRGTLGGLPVVRIAEGESGVKHVVRGALEVGANVEGHINWPRRFDHMQQHSGQHLLSRVLLEDFNLRTVSFHLGEETCTIDLEGATPEASDLEAAEARANEVVFANAPIVCRVVGSDEFDAMAGGSARGSGAGSAAGGGVGSAPDSSSGSRVLRSRLPAGVERVRIVEIVDFDSSTCCGTHVRSTGEIGVIKILGTEKVKGNTRVSFICGWRAVRDYAAKHKMLAEAAAAFTTDWRGVPGILEKLSEDHRGLRKRSEELGRELARFKAAELSQPTGSAGGFDIVKKVFAEGDAAFLRETASRIREHGKRIVLFGLSGPIPALVFACSPDAPLNMGELMKASAAVIGARGGGGKDLAQGGGGDGAKVSQALDEAERRIKEALA